MLFFKFLIISIITINYKQAEVTNQLLASLASVTWSRIEVIVVDNNSGEKDFELLNNSYRNVKIVRNNKNLGFAGANNIGIKVSSGDYILLLIVLVFENFNSIYITNDKRPKSTA